MSGMIAKLNNDGAFHRWRWSCVWRPGVGGGLDARGDWVRAGGVGAGDGWLTVELGSGEDAGFKLWETREALEFQRFAYGIGFDDLEFSEFLKKSYSPFNIDWQKHHQRLVRLCETMKLTDPEVTGHRAIITKVEIMILVGINGAIDGVIEKEKGAK